MGSNKRKETQITESCEPINNTESESKIAEIAYYKAQNRDFEPGHELDDWLEAERELMQCECD